MRRVVVAALAAGLSAAGGPAASATSWQQIYAYEATGAASAPWPDHFQLWGTPGRHTKANLPGRDYKIELSLRRNDCVSPGLGIATMPVLSVKGLPPYPNDPRRGNDADPSLSEINEKLDGVRLSIMSAYNKNPDLNNQLRLRVLPGATEVGDGSANVYPFTCGRWHFVVVEKVGKTVTVRVTPQGEARKQFVWSTAAVRAKSAPAFGIYVQPYRDITMRFLRLYRPR